MALLIVLILFLASHSAFADLDPAATFAVVFDKGDPQSSVGIVGESIVEVNDLYEDFRVRGFDRQAIIFEHVETKATYRMTEQGEPASGLVRQARDRFIVKQMEKIFQAQLKYLEQQKSGYAPNLETLLVHGYLDDGFETGEKQGYYFEIMETGKTERRAPHFEREPTFMAVAEPFSQEGLYFTVDHLGLVRFAESRSLATWGPVWDYADHGKPRTRDITVDS